MTTSNYRRDAVEQAREAILEDYVSGYVTADEVYDFATQRDVSDYFDTAQHEWADGHEWCVYTSRQYDLLAAGVLDEYFEEAEEFVTIVESARPADIHFQLIAAATYLLLRACYFEGAVDARNAIAVGP